MSSPGPTDQGKPTGDDGARPVRPAACIAPNVANTVRIPLAPVACWRLADPAFDFDSSFILPSFANEVGNLADLVGAPDKKGCRATIFAHADPVGSDEVNKAISDRRAVAVYALLTRKPEMWEDLYSNPVDGDRWGTRSIQAMLMNLEHSGGGPYYPGPVDGEYGPNTTDAVERFQGENGLSVDGRAGPHTRKKLFTLYMNFICTRAGGSDSSSAPPPFQMKPSDFLGGGADGGKMALQGCSRFNPVVLLPKSLMNGDDEDERNKQDAPNRRVLLFLFHKDANVAKADWPCPRVKEPVDGCKAQFWPDADKRRQNEEARREYTATRDTMACRFYDRFARRSPCENESTSFVVEVHLLDDSGEPMTNVNYQLTVGGKTFSGVSPDGWVTATLTPPVCPASCSVEWFSTDSPDGPKFSAEVTVDCDQGSSHEVADAKLHNLGFTRDQPLDQRVRSFQAQYESSVTGLDADGTIPKATLSRVDKVYDDAIRREPSGDA